MQITLDKSTLCQIVVTALVTRMDHIERSIIDYEKRFANAMYATDRKKFQERLEELRELFCIYEKVLRDHGFNSYEYAAEHYNIPTLRRDEKFTAN